MVGRIAFLVFLLLGCAASPPLGGPAALESLIDAAADGRLPPVEYHGVSPGDPAASAAFVYVEEWLNVNGESVHDVRTHAIAREGAFRFTESKDGRHVYLISRGWPGPQVRTAALRPRPRHEGGLPRLAG